MTDREPKIGDVLMKVRGGPWGHVHAEVTEEGIEQCRDMVKSGRWVIVDKKPQEEQSQ